MHIRWKYSRILLCVADLSGTSVIHSTSQAPPVVSEANERSVPIAVSTDLHINSVSHRTYSYTVLRPYSSENLSDRF